MWETGLMVLALSFLAPPRAARASFPGEEADRSYDPTPETINFQESWARNGPHRQAGALSEDQKEQPQPQPLKTRRFAPSRVSSIVHLWPGPRRPAGPLRDAPAPAVARTPPAEAYSLWRGVSAPLLLPAEPASGPKPLPPPARRMPTYPDFSSRTDLLVGIQARPGQTPREALEAPLGRLSAVAGFSLRRIVGFQRIPGTDRLALIIEGQVPVRGISRVLSDPAVVKVAPSPRQDAVLAASAGPAVHDPAGFLRFFRDQHPALLVLVLLASSTLMSSFLRRARVGAFARRRRAPRLLLNRR